VLVTACKWILKAFQVKREDRIAGVIYWIEKFCEGIAVRIIDSLRIR
jgi:hypothetical protein